MSHAWLASRPTASSSSPRPLSAIATPSSTSHPLCLAQPSRRTWTEPETGGEPQIDRLPRPALATGLSLTGSGRREPLRTAWSTSSTIASRFRVISQPG